MADVRFGAGTWTGRVEHGTTNRELTTQNQNVEHEPGTWNLKPGTGTIRSMADSLTVADVERIAALAHLQLTTQEKELFARQLADVLAYARQLQALDTTGVPATSQVNAHQLERPDEPRPSLTIAEALANAPDAAPDAGLFRVPRVIG
jgi:aspartyl-tRNA(Asn)/glutamyl-tRNA(Gln) amidotransferase subunit C